MNRPRPRRLAPPLVAAALLAGATAAQGTHFVDVSEATGMLFEHENGLFGYSMGAGAGWLDYDQDGDADLLVTSSDGLHALLRNDGASFSDATAGSGISGTMQYANIGVSIADYDADGRLDALLLNRGPNQLYRNLGAGAFQDVAPQLGLAGFSWSSGASWADFDLDGDLDLYVVNYIAKTNFPYHFGEPNQLYLNEGTPEAPHFVERGAELGVEDSGVFGPSVPGYTWVSPEGERTAGCGLTASTLDYDEDGDPDLLVGNDFGQWVLPDRFYRNDLGPGGLAFSDLTEENQFHQGEEYCMGINGADYDMDGDWDFYHTNLGENVFLRDDGGVYVDVADLVGPLEGCKAEPALGCDEDTKLVSSWGTYWGDFDNDGWEDLLVVNGLVPATCICGDPIDPVQFDEVFQLNEARSPNHLWMNQGDGTFEMLDEELSGMNDEGMGRGVAVHDVNADGLLDFYTTNNGHTGLAEIGDANRMFLNAGTLGDPSNHWVRLALDARSANWQAIGARVYADAGALTLKRQVLADNVYVVASDRTVHFGFGPHATIDRLEVAWPSGTSQVLFDVPTDRTYKVKEPLVGAGVPAAPVLAGGELRLATELVHRAPPTGEGAADALARFELRLPGAAEPLLEGTVARVLERGERATVELALPLAPALAQALAGATVEVRVGVLADGSLDARRAHHVLP